MFQATQLSRFNLFYNELTFMIKNIHIICAILSFAGFFLRGILSLFQPMILQKKWVKVLPHVVDSILLTSAVVMLYTMNLSILKNDWLIAKIIALVLYIALGMIALRPSFAINIRILTWIFALTVFIYIVSVAITKSVWGFLS